MRTTLALLSMVGIASAQPKPAPVDDGLVQAKIVASSTLTPKGTTNFEATNAISGDMSNHWCEGNAKGTAGETLTVELDRPIALETVFIKGDRSYAVPEAQRATVTGVRVLADGKPVEVSFGLSAKIKGAAVKKLEITIEKVYGPADGVACIDELRFFVGERETISVYTGELARLDALRPRLRDLRDGLTKCNAKKLGTVVKFPIAKSEWVGEDYGGHGGREKLTKVRNAAKLAQLCKSSKKRWGAPGVLGDAPTSVEFEGVDEASTVGGTLKWIDEAWWLVSLR